MCGHTYCESCIDSCKTQQEGLTTFTCPEDNATLTVAQETVQTFPKNIALMKLIDSKRNTSMEFKDESINVSKITKGEEAQEDEDEKELMEAINASKDHKKDNSTTQSNRCES